MTITRQLVGVYISGDTVAALPAGSDRLLIVKAAVGDGATITALTINGQAATEIIQNNDTGDTTALFYIKEADLPTGGGTLTVTGPALYAKYEVSVLDNVDQTAPIAVSGKANGNETVSVTGVVGVNGGMAITVDMQSSSSFPTISAGYTDGSDLQGSFSNRGRAAYKPITDTSDNVFTWTGSTAIDQNTSWAVVSPLAASETATTGNIPLVIQAGYTLVDLVSPVTTNASLLFGFTGDTPVTGDDLEYDVTSALDSGVTLSVAATGVWTVTEAVSGDWVTDITVSRRVVQADGTIGTEAVVTLSAAAGLTTIGGMVSAMVSNIVSTTVN